ncbi:heavy-metal-associated domain-containing protein [Methanosarcina sp. Mfa9]|uniref:heavy-metal-associated domain-containing protein n=1 Tax=Methanosarcina sp. Mfa9 TaxID=3439063 RepID=UPI003F83B80F
MNITQEAIRVEGMSCGHCVMTVKKAIESLEGVKEANVSLEDKKAVVEYDEKKVELEDIRAAVKEAGYEPV